MKIIFLDPSGKEDGFVSCVKKCRESAHLALGQVFHSCGDMYGSATLTSEIALRTFKCFQKRALQESMDSNLITVSLWPLGHVIQSS